MSDGLEAQVYAAAERLHDEVGAAFTMEQLEAAARVSRATIYRRIGGKRAVLRHLAGGGEPLAREDARTRILEATRRVFGARGPHAATMEQIAAEAGVGPATVYRHFGDREGLVRAFVHEMTPRTLIHEGWLRPTGDVGADLRHHVPLMLEAFATHRDVLRWVMFGGDQEQRLLDRLRTPEESSFARVANYFRAQIDAGVVRTSTSPEDAALSLLGMIIAAAIIGPLHYGLPAPDPERTGPVLVELFLHGLAS